MVFFTGIRRNWDKIELYIISLWLLFLLIIFITADIPIYLGRDWKFIGFNTIVRQNLIPLFALLLLILGMIFYTRFSYKLGGSDQIPFEIKKFQYNKRETRIHLHTKTSKNLFLKLLNDDFLLSELTKRHYESMAKDHI